MDSSIWLHMWLWYFCEDAVLARLSSLLKTLHVESGHETPAYSVTDMQQLTCSMNSMLIRFSMSLITR